MKDEYKKVQEARAAGKKAFADGIDYETGCPYQPHTAEWRAWRDLYRMAKRGRV